MFRRKRPIVFEQDATAGWFIQLPVTGRLIYAHTQFLVLLFNVDPSRADVYAMHLCLDLVHNLSRISYALLQDQMA